MLVDSNTATDVWVSGLKDVILKGNETSPRGLKTKEILGYALSPINMEYPIVVHGERKMNFPFMFAEAAWIVSGQNILSPITKIIKNYANYSDDGVFMRGAYGPKFIEQLPWVVETLSKDADTRQAIISIWRERPGQSKDIPCTLNLQFFIRDGSIHTIANMRSQDMVWGYCYDVFTFTMMTLAVKICLKDIHNIDVNLGNLHMRYGSAHIYEDYWDKAKEWIATFDQDPYTESVYRHYNMIKSSRNYEELCTTLTNITDTCKTDIKRLKKNA